MAKRESRSHDENVKTCTTYSLSSNSYKPNRLKTLKLSINDLTNSPSIPALISIEYESFIAQFNQLTSLPKQILRLKPFKKYSTCQCLIHEKGASRTISLHHFPKNKNDSESWVPVSDFNLIFDIVKRSKNKLFDQSQLLSKHLDVVGIFLAVTLDIHSHQVVIILSRNDFLPPTNEEYLIFSKLIHSFSNHIAWVIQEDLRQTRADIFNVAIKTLKETASKNAVLKSKHYHVRKVELLGELLNTLKHELSNPIFGIKLTADLLAEKKGELSSIDLLLAISTEASRCQSIIDNFSKLYALNKDLNVCSIQSIIHESIVITKSVCRDIKRDITYNGNSTNEDILIKTNRVWVIQILFNIIVNCAHALNNRSAKKIEIIINNMPSNVSITIKDNGPGIPKQITDKIFEPFFTTKDSGTGLGLTICSYLSLELGGSITVNDEVIDEGAQFTLTLPKDDISNENFIN